MQTVQFITSSLLLINLSNPSPSTICENLFLFSLQVGVFYLQKWTNPLPNIFIDTWLGKGQLNLHIKSNIMSSVGFSWNGSPLVPDISPARRSFISTKLTFL